MPHLTRDPIDVATLTESVRRPGCGAVLTFLGTVRDLTGDEVTTALDYEAYEPMAETVLAGIAQEVRDRWPAEVAIVHRLGYLEVGAISVAIAVACPHRGQAFDACRHAIERLKESAPIWKRDHAPAGTAWIHPGVEEPS